MARNKRTVKQRVADRNEIAKLIIAGKRSPEITEYINSIRPYNLSVTSIIHDMKMIEKQWTEEYLSDINTAKARELKRIDRIEEEAWRAWEESKNPLTKTEKEKIENEQQNKAGATAQRHSKMRAKTTTQEKNADKEFMSIVQWCVEQRCKILGINAPQRYDISWRKEALAAGVDPDKLQSELVNEFVEAASRGVKA